MLSEECHELSPVLASYSHSFASLIQSLFPSPPLPTVWHYMWSTGQNRLPCSLSSWGSQQRWAISRGTIVTVLASMFSGMCVTADLAMTGEVTLLGMVLPVGGVDNDGQ